MGPAAPSEQCLSGVSGQWEPLVETMASQRPPALSEPLYVAHSSWLGTALPSQPSSWSSCQLWWMLARPWRCYTHCLTCPA